MTSFANNVLAAAAALFLATASIAGIVHVPAAAGPVMAAAPGAALA